METYIPEVKVRSGEYRDGTPHYIRGFALMKKGISYGRVEGNDRALRALLVPAIQKKYVLTFDQSEKVFDMIEDGIKKRVRLRLMLDVLDNETKKIVSKRFELENE
jgi:hypothetical protein